VGEIIGALLGTYLLTRAFGWSFRPHAGRAVVAAVAVLLLALVVWPATHEGSPDGTAAYAAVLYGPCVALWLAIDLWRSRTDREREQATRDRDKREREEEEERQERANEREGARRTLGRSTEAESGNGDLWYLKAHDGEVQRVTLDDLDEAFQAGRVDENALVRRAGATKWAKLGELARLKEPAPTASVVGHCNSCGMPMHADARFCDECGANVAAACFKCGASNREGARFCKQCGAPIGAAPEVADSVEAPRAPAPERLDRPREDRGDHAAPVPEQFDGRCPGCGKRNSLRAWKCDKCGRVLPNPE
jgi:hypothetical protein